VNNRLILLENPLPDATDFQYIVDTLNGTRRRLHNNLTFAHETLKFSYQFKLKGQMSRNALYIKKQFAVRHAFSTVTPRIPADAEIVARRALHEMIDNTMAFLFSHAVDDGESLTAPVFVSNTTNKMLRLLESKGHDYASHGTNTLSNFISAHEFAIWVTSPLQVFGSNIGNKLSRLLSLWVVGDQPKHETIFDSHVDFMNYCVLVDMYLHFYGFELPQENIVENWIKEHL